MNKDLSLKIQHVEGAEERNEENVKHVVAAILQSHCDTMRLVRYPTEVTLEDMILQLKDTAISILTLADEIHRVHSGMGDNPSRPCSETAKDIWDSTRQDLIEFKRDMENGKPKKNKKAK